LNFDLENDNLPLQIKLNSNEQPALTLEWGFKLAFGFDETDGFFLYTYPDNESEFFIKADFDLPVASSNAKLLYFLNFYLEAIHIEFGAGIFVDIDKEKAMRSDDNRNSVRYGRVSRDDIQNKIPVKKDLFVVCAAVAAALEVDNATVCIFCFHRICLFYCLLLLKLIFICVLLCCQVEMDVPIADLNVVKPWVPKLNIGKEASTKALQASNITMLGMQYNVFGLTFVCITWSLTQQAIIKKEVSSARNRRSLKEPDQRRLELSIPTTAHRGLRMLCSEELLDLHIDCPVDTAANEFA
jgi:hypothetical protein